MTAKHTPGPWTAQPARSERGDYYHRILADAEVHSKCIATTVDAMNGDREAMEADAADARLIASAPDLLAALQDADKALAALIVTFHEEAPKCSKGYTFPALTTLNAIRDTLARATGGAR